MSDWHEAESSLSEEARNIHRALNSLREEIEAADWYHQRAATSQDPGLRQVLRHNLEDEIEHACMVLEWLRRTMPGWDRRLRTYLFTDGPIVRHEMPGEGAGPPPRATGPRPFSR